MREQKDKQEPIKFFYKGYLVEPSAYRAEDGRTWKARPLIWIKDRESIRIQPIYPENNFRTEEEALNNARLIGMQAIDSGIDAQV